MLSGAWSAHCIRDRIQLFKQILITKCWNSTILPVICRKAAHYHYAPISLVLRVSSLIPNVVCQLRHSPCQHTMHWYDNTQSVRQHMTTHTKCNVTDTLNLVSGCPVYFSLLSVLDAAASQVAHCSHSFKSVISGFFECSSSASSAYNIFPLFSPRRA